MQQPKILIIDDEVAHLEAIIDIIEEAGFNYEIFSALNGKSALEIAKKELPDLVITDWEMPQMSGIELIEHLKKDIQTADIPVIMCTGIMTTSENLETALKVGAVDYLRKPIDKIELIARINASLQLADKYNEVKKLNEAKDKIFSVIAHDLQGPVGAIKFFVEFILSNIHNYSTKELENYIEMLSKQSSSVYSILKNLLSWANSQRKNIKFQPENQYLIKAVVHNITLLQSSAEKKGITIQNNISEDIKATFDLNLISTVIRNLIGNAIKYTTKNGIVSIDVTESDQFYTVIVSDTGMGIDAERVSKIFDRSSYETTYGTDDEKGSGLGLKLCLEFVEIHKGKIWVESELGKGSKFHFTIPKH